MRILQGEYQGKIGTVGSVGRECVYVRVPIGTKRKPENDEVRLFPQQVRRISGGKAMFP